MSPFIDRFPELGARETRMAVLPQPSGGLPADRYGFMEWYCTDPACDCRRVFIEVRTEREPGRVLASINFGWESIAFYTDKLHGNAKGAAEICEGALDPINQQSDLAPALLDLFQTVVLQDRAYVDRLARHYRMFKEATGATGATEAQRGAAAPAATGNASQPADQPDFDKIDDAVLALLHLTRFTEGGGPNRIVRAWKGQDWEALNRLHARGLIGDPVRKSKSVTLTPEGERRAKELFQRLFGG
jgi:hypothetical protein